MTTKLILKTQNLIFKTISSRTNTNFASLTIKRTVLFELSFGIVGANNEIPSSLSIRSENVAFVASLMLAISFFIIAFARLSSKQMVLGMIKAIYKNKQIDKIIQDEYPLNNASSFFLILNYIVSTSALLFLCIPVKDSLDPKVVFLLLPIPFLMVFLPWFSLFLVGFLTGEKNTVIESKINTFIFAHFAGIIYSLMLLIWAFNMQWSSIFFHVFVWFTFVLWIYRFFRGFIFAIKKGVTWYYIILYFCTLEILPFVLIYFALYDKILEQFNWLLN